VQVEAVTYLSGRSSSLMAAFYLGALLVYLRGGHWALSGLLFALAVATKETALTLPAALLLCEQDLKSALRRQWPHWAIFVAGLAFVLLNPRYLELATFGFTRRDFADNLLTQVGGVSYLVARLIGLQGPNIDPALPVLEAWSPAVLLQASLLALLLLAGILQLRRRAWLGFGILWFFLQLAPTNSLIPRLDVANDRQLYLAGWGLFLALAVQLGAFSRVALAAAAVVCALGSVARQLDYTSEIALWEADARRAPWNARAYNNLGHAYQQAGRTQDAGRAYEAALAFDPGHPKARMNLLLLDLSGRYRPERTR
jgi:tetratricopeptide (TPR) repeat protein